MTHENIVRITRMCRTLMMDLFLSLSSSCGPAVGSTYINSHDTCVNIRLLSVRDTRGRIIEPELAELTCLSAQMMAELRSCVS